MNIDDDNFSNIIKENKFTVIDFLAPWCGPCRALSPFIDKLIDEYKDNKDIVFCKANVEETPLTAEKLDVKNLPCVVLFKNATEVDRVVGFNQVGVKAMIESNL